MTLSPVELDALARLGVSEKALTQHTAALAASREDDRMTVAVEEATGAQLLPNLRMQHPRQTISHWSAFCCLSADRRIKYQTERDLAARIIIRQEGRHHDPQH